MKTLTLKTADRHEVTALIPERADVANLKVGDIAPSVMGLYRVTEIFGRGTNVNGCLFVCYHVQWSEGSTMSASMVEGEIVPTVSNTSGITSDELRYHEEIAARELGILPAAKIPGGFLHSKVNRAAVIDTFTEPNGWLLLKLANGENRYVRAESWAA